jgi:hypothetical protein
MIFNKNDIVDYIGWLDFFKENIFIIKDIDNQTKQICIESINDNFRTIISTNEIELNLLENRKRKIKKIRNKS